MKKSNGVKCLDLLRKVKVDLMDLCKSFLRSTHEEENAEYYNLKMDR